MTQNDTETLFVHNALLEMMDKQKWTMGTSLLLVCAVLAAIGFRQDALWYWVAWLVLMTFLMYAPRTIWARFFAPSADLALARRAMRWTVGDAFLSGAGASLCLFAFPVLNDGERLLYTVILISVAMGNVLNAGSNPKIFWAFTAPVIGFLSLMWLLYPNPGDASLLRFALGTLLIVPFVPMMYVFVQNIWVLFDESCRLRFRENALNEQLQKALDVAEQANRAKTRFLAAASHDLRQPLHVIGLVGSALRFRPLDEKSHEMVGVLNQASESLQSLLGSLLDVSKLDSDLFETRLEMLAMDELVRHFYQEYAPLVTEQGLSAQLTVDVPEPCWVVTDAGLLMRVLHNLGQNALKFTTDGQIQIRLSHHDNNVWLDVEDTGCGIAPEHQEEVFQEFFQVGNHTRDVSRGLGLGLSIVQRLARLLHMEVTCLSQVGKGTRMRLSMAMMQPNEAQLQSYTQAHPDEHTPASIPQGLRVLVVDDEPAVLEASRLLLTELGCVVWTAFDLDEERECLRDMLPDLLMVDFRLKHTSGIEVIQTLRQEFGEHIRAVLVSGDTAPERLLLAKDAGIHICHKPLTLEKLRAELVGAASPPVIRHAALDAASLD